jgi:hypothetical protein
MDSNATVNMNETASYVKNKFEIEELKTVLNSIKKRLQGLSRGEMNKIFINFKNDPDLMKVYNIIHTV